MLSWVDILALGWFSLVWSGYTLYAKKRAKTATCLSFEMRRKRNHWMQQMLRRDNKMADVGLISTLERNVSFFASSCLLILAGLLTVLTSSERLSHVLSGLIPWSVQSETQIQVKLVAKIEDVVGELFG